MQRWPNEAAAPDKRKLNLRPLASLIPYVRRYRGRALGALGALVLAALTTLIVPIAVRRMIDFGFTARGLALINSYFLVMIGVAAVLAFASAARYYLVTTLGERIVADLRGDVFAHLTALSANFFDEAKTGEVISRLTADTTQIKASVGSSVSVALRNLRAVRRRQRHDGGDEPAALRLRARRDPDHRAAALRVRPRGAPPLALCPGHARRRVGLCGRADRGGAHPAGLHQRAARHCALSRRGGARLRGGARIDPRARAADRVRDLSRLRQRRVVLWFGAQDVLSARITPGRLGQFVLYAVFAAGALGSLSEIGGEIAAASGAAERLFEILAIKPAIVRPAKPLALPSPPRGEAAFEDVRLFLSDAF